MVPISKVGPAAPKNRECGGEMMAEPRMRRENVRWFVWGALALAALSLVWAGGWGKRPPSAKASSRAGATEPSRAASPNTLATPTERAITRAGRDGKYSFVLFYRPREQASEAMRDTFDRAKGKLGSQAVFLAVDINARGEAGLVEKYRVRQAPLPLTLVMAPNGAVVRAFTKAVDEKALGESFASAKFAEVLGALQARKLVAVCLQGAGTRHNAESKQAAQQFIADAKLGGQAVLVMADPRKEADLLKRCGISSPPRESTVLMIVPPGRLVATVAGATTKDALMAKLTASLSSCGPGCAPSGCAPR
jgi:hypothetical protein